MNDFDYEVLEKKRLTYGAFHKVNGSKSEKCTLPSDYMTAKQKREMNGTMETYNYNKPMQWAEFRKLSDYSKTEYINGLKERYGTAVTYSSLSRMMGCALATIKNSLIRLGFDFGRAGTIKWEYREAFNKFCSGETETPEEDVEEVEEKTDEPVIPLIAPSAVVTNFSLTFNGRISIGDVATKLAYLIGNTSEGTLNISFEGGCSDVGEHM